MTGRPVGRYIDAGGPASGEVSRAAPRRKRSARARSKRRD
jgi:hypothetical protein